MAEGAAGERRSETSSPLPKRVRRRRLRRRILIGVGVLVLLLLMLVALVPLAGSRLAPSQLASELNKSINGTATVEGARFSWFGGQTLGPVVIKDSAGEQVASLSIRVERGLLKLGMAGIGMGPLDLGQARLSGSATIVRDPSGVTNLEKLAKSSQTQPQKKPARIPPSLTGGFALDNFDVRFIDEGKLAQKAPGSVVHLPDIAGQLAIADGKSISANLSSAVRTADMPGGTETPAGGIKLVGTVSNLTDKDGYITPDQAVVEAKIDAEKVSMAVADTLAGMDNRLASALGESLQAQIRARGSLQNAEASISAATPAASIAATLKIADGILSTDQPATITARGPAIVTLVPALQKSVAQSRDVTFEQLPDVTITLSELRAPLPKQGQPLNLLGAKIAAELRTTEMRGQVRVPEAPGGAPQPFTVAPIVATVTTADLAQSINIRASTASTLAGKPAGEINIDLAVVEPLDANGKIRDDVIARLRGRGELSNLTTAIADPFVQPLGIDLSRDVGPRLDAHFEATTAAAAPETPASTIPPTNATLSIESTNVRVAAQLSFDGVTLRTGPDGIRLSMAQAGPLAAAMLGDGGFKVESADQIEFTARDLTVDLKRLRAGQASDLRAIAGLLELRTGPISGTLTVKERPAQAWAMAPVSATVDGSNAASGVVVKATTAATLDKEPAGDLNVDLVVSSLFAPDGSIGKAPEINGRAVLQNIATAVAQQFVAETGLDLPAGVGPRMNVILAAKSAADPQSPQGRATDLDVSLRSEGVTADALLTLTDGVVRHRGEGAQVTVRDMGALVGPAARRGGVLVTNGGYFKLVATKFSVPYREGPTKTAAAVEVTTGNFNLLPIEPTEPTQPGTSAEPQPIAIKQILAKAELAPGSPARVQVRGSGSHEGAKPFLIDGDITVPNVGTGALRPLGKLELRNVPTTLASLVSGLQGGGKLNPIEIARSTIGPAINLNLAAVRPEGAAETARDVSLSLQSRGLNGQARVNLTDAELAIQELGFTGIVSPDLAGKIIDALSPGLASKPQLEGPATLRLTATPFTVPLGQGARPDLQQAGDATITLGVEGTTRITNIAVQSKEGPRDIGPLGIRDILLTAKVPVASLTSANQAGNATAKLTGAVLGPDDAEILSLNGDATVTLAAARPTSDLKAGFDVQVRDTRRVDALLNRKGLLADGVGPEAMLRTTTEVKFLADNTAGKVQVAQTIFHAGVESAKLRTKEPLHLDILKDRIVLGHPAQVSWLMEPAWANWYLLQAGAVAEGADEAVRFISPAEVSLDIYRLAIAKAEKKGPLLQDIFDLDVRITSPGGRMIVSGARGEFSGIQARVRKGEDPGTLGFSLTVQNAGGGEAPEGKPAVNARGFLSSVADADGNVTSDKALLTGSIDAVGLPTPIIDAAAKQNGLLVDVLGPTTSLRASGRSVSRIGGNVEAVGTSPRAEARLAGTIHDGAFLAEGKPTVTLKEITPELGKRMLAGVPLIGLFQKTTAQAPAVLTATNLTVPIDGDLSKLNGDVVFDFGEASFSTSTLFGKFLKAAGQREAGVIGRRIEPVNIIVRNGVATYERFSIPLGEFTLDTSGTVNLVNRSMNVVTYVPFGALTDEAAGILNTGLGSVLGGAIPTIEKASMVPLRASGTFDNPQVRPDMELFLKQAGKNLLRPDQIIGGSLKDIFDKIGNNKNGR